ncbi:flavodoxin family protein [Brotomerdimonas butyrica]|uniref:flavodoxin family protein n=1 Tax=Brotomerdimonas butyrica TaxID=2981721 RepID=UPI0021D15CDF|nr:flavodoxin family protein [Brotomerdimonas butyrica]MCU6755034.1 flavodoxin family protein [Brotomerdimonas butyrica]
MLTEGEAGHEVTVLDVGKMKIAGCLACEYCHTKGEGKCVQKDDMEKVYPALLECDALVLASPIYYFTMTAQIQATIQRIYAIDHPPKATKAALMLSSMSPEVYEGSIGEYEGIIDYMGLEDRGIITADDSENGTEALMEKCRALGKAM